MKSRTKLRLTLLGIVLLTVLAGLIDYPKGPDINIGNIQREVKVYLGLDLQGGTSLLYNADVSEIPTENRGESLQGVRDVIERRINAFGVGEPNIQTVRSGEDWRILVELPGVTDITEAVNRIGETPLLEFKTEGEPEEYTEEEIEAIRSANEEVRIKAETILTRVQSGEDFAELAREFSEDPGSAEKGGELGELTQGATVPEFDEVLFEKGTPGEIYPELVKTVFGYHIIQLETREEVVSAAQESENTEQPAEGENLEQPAVDTEETAPELVATARHILLRTEPEEPVQRGINYVDTGLTGEQLDRADVILDPNTGLPTVSISFNSEGRKLFGQITEENLQKTIAIYLDGEIISSPVVQSKIENGEAVITGSFTFEEAQDLAKRLNAGALPVPIELISQSNVGPTLGQESIERSLFAGGLGLVLLALFMIVYYRLPGFVAVTALGIYSLLVLAVFKLIPVTLTLAGVAGFILSIGMAVDANVLIFERMREELRNGKPIKKAINDGFQRAWPSIRDSNMSSIITCFILYWFGSSLIRGFAITLAIGIIISMFSAITISRSLLTAWAVKNPAWYGIRKRKSE